eukprot:COSAG06_NODE_406_length_16115_cov_38.420142_12_plen_64_part_00
MKETDGHWIRARGRSSVTCNCVHMGSAARLTLQQLAMGREWIMSTQQTTDLHDRVRFEVLPTH